MPTRLIELVERLPRSRVLLVGDVMMDRYLYGDVDRISPEAPVPVLHFRREELRLGGAGNVAANLAVLNAAVSVVAVVGDDPMGKQVRLHLHGMGCDESGVIEVPGRPTVTKLRLVGSAQHRHAQTMLRLDYEDRGPVSDAVGAEIVRRVEAGLARGADVLCMEDYNKGLLTPDVCRAVIAAARGRGVPVIVDPAVVPDYSKYAGATAIKLNRVETEKATGLPVDTPEQWQAAAERLLDKLGLEAAVVTLDASGSFLATRGEGEDGGERRWLRTRARQVFDVTGAGDMVHATVTVARAGGATWPEAVALANVAAGLEVERFGCVPIRPEEIIQELLIEAHEHLGKERDLARLLPELARHRAAGRRIVFTNGCFDLVHLGHVQYFRFAKAQGDLLVVGVNTDAGIRRLKGAKRPIIGEHDRVTVLEELESIDYLVRFDEDTPMTLIEQIRPDVLVKGADYKKEQVVGWDTVEGYGGRVALAPLVDGRSTSAVIQRILDAYS